MFIEGSSDCARDPSLWTIEPGRAMRLPTQSIGKAAPRRLRVRAGRLWLTTFGNEHEQAADVWLEPGDEIALPAGKRWVAEGWPTASFEILIAPGAG